MPSDMVRITGMNSGMDTEAVISAYTAKTTARIDKEKGNLTKNEWTQDIWKGLNSKIYGFYSGTLATNRMSSAFAKTKVTTSNGALSVVAGSNAVKGVQTAQIKATASAAYLTGSKVAASSGSDSLTEKLGIDEGETITFKGNDGTTKTIQIGGEAADENTKVVNTMDELVSAFKSCGINANFDAGNQRLFLSAKSSGADNDFSLSADNIETLDKLGLATKDQLAEAGLDTKNAASKIDGSNAKLILNGAEFESNTNSFTINGNTYTINYMPADTNEQISVTTATDYDGVYDVVKNMLSEYNKLVNEMSKMYNADSSKGYNPLTDDQKSEMSDKEVEDWENKIKDSLLRKDSNLFDAMSALTDTINEGFTVNGKTMYLSDFGISTMGYFEAEENERYALHIDGDKDDSNTAGKTDKLKALIASDPETVTSFFTQFSAKMYDNLYKKMGSSSLSSIYKVYNDKQLKSENTDLKKKVEDLEAKLTAIEDKWYKKFSAMETLLSKINSKQSSLTGMFG